MKTTVRWFRNGHEHRNYWLRFGFMRLHREGMIRYREEPLANATTTGFSEAISRHEHRHTSLIAVESGGKPVRCIVDSEDSFLCMAGLIEHADLYFCAGYNSTFFREKKFEPPYSWLKAHETAFYRQRANEILTTQGPWFDRVRPFVPIGPDLTRRTPIGQTEQRLRNAYDKVMRSLSSDEPWRFALADFEFRYDSLLELRNRPAEHDIVLLDTLWGWPRHRLELHRRLQELAAAGNDIHSRLNWSEPSPWDGSDKAPLDSTQFPVITGKVEGYESMLASSRLAVFASGFHWGWRNIMTLALMWGLPILADRLFLQPWFDLDRFKIFWNDEFDWNTIPSTLAKITEPTRAAIISHNTELFDELLTPERVAAYVIRTCENQTNIYSPEFSPHKA